MWRDYEIQCIISGRRRLCLPPNISRNIILSGRELELETRKLDNEIKHWLAFTSDKNAKTYNLRRRKEEFLPNEMVYGKILFGPTQCNIYFIYPRFPRSSLDRHTSREGYQVTCVKVDRSHIIPVLSLVQRIVNEYLKKGSMRDEEPNDLRCWIANLLEV